MDQEKELEHLRNYFQADREISAAITQTAVSAAIAKRNAAEQALWCLSHGLPDTQDQFGGSTDMISISTKGNL